MREPGPAITVPAISSEQMRAELLSARKRHHDATVALIMDRVNSALKKTRETLQQAGTMNLFTPSTDTYIIRSDKETVEQFESVANILREHGYTVEVANNHIDDDMNMKISV